jgi:hypothetical protein
VRFLLLISVTLSAGALPEDNFYGRKLKWQNGLHYAHMQDDAGDGGKYQGWGFISGLRVYW